jgi:hypothetical protein
MDRKYRGISVCTVVAYCVCVWMELFRFCFLTRYSTHCFVYNVPPTEHNAEAPDEDEAPSSDTLDQS